MKLTKSLLLIPAASFLVAAIASGACSSSVTITAPPDEVALPAGLVIAGLPASCDANTYWAVDSAGDLCGGGQVYVLCGTSTYTQYVCDDPSDDGWTEGAGDTDTTVVTNFSSTDMDDDGGHTSSSTDDDGGMSSDEDGGQSSSESNPSSESSESENTMSETSDSSST